MNVLWITNILFPEAEKLITGEGELKASGGWMLGAAEALMQYNDIKLYVATVSSKVDNLIRFEGECITYFVLPYGKGNLRVNEDYIPYWKQVNDQISPDIVHIHGTEFSHGYAYVQACGNEHVVVSIQGLTSAYAPYYNYGISTKDIIINLTFRDILRGTLFQAKHDFHLRGKYEIKLLQSVNHIIGRTSWDRARTWAINPDAEYHFCNETLRPQFYDGSKWNYDKCNKHSIFLSQAGYPIKGLHQVLKAMPLVLRHYPDAIIRVAGSDITRSVSFKDKLRLSGYGLYIKRLIKKYKLEGKVIFTGNLNADQMKQEYLKANVFVCPSSIENSPNSLGEAQILGVPCVASYVGGVMDMMYGDEDNMYRFEEIEMLAYKLSRIFSNHNYESMHKIAKMRHDSKENTSQLYRIYSDL